MANLIRKFCVRLVALAVAGVVALPPSFAAQPIKSRPLEDAVRLDPLYREVLDSFGSSKVSGLLRRLSNKYPESPEITVFFADVLALNSKFEKSLDQFKKLDIESFDLKGQHHIRCGMSACEVRLGKEKEAEPAIKKIMSVPPFPGEADSYGFLANKLSDSGNHRKALEVLNWAMSVKYPDRQLRTLLTMRAVAYRRLDQRAESLRDLKAAEKITPGDDANANFALAHAYFEGNFPSEVVSLSSRIMLQCKGDQLRELLYIRGQCLNALGKTADVEKEANKMVTLLPKDRLAFHEAARLFLMIGQPIKAANLLDRAVQLSSDPREIMQAQAAQLGLQQRFAESLKLSTQGIAKYPDYTPMRIARAQALTGLGRKEECIEECNRILKASPHELPAIAMRAESYYSQQAYDRAVIDFEKGRKLVPSDANVLIQIFTCYEKIGDKESAKRTTSEFVKTLPTMMVPAQVEFAASVFCKSKIDDVSIAAFERALALRKDQNSLKEGLDSMSSLVELYQSKKDRQKSLFWLQKLASLTVSTQNKVRLTRLYLQDGRLAEAKKLADAALDSPCSQENRQALLHMKASILRRMGRQDEATLVEREFGRTFR